MMSVVSMMTEKLNINNQVGHPEIIFSQSFFIFVSFLLRDKFELKHNKVPQTILLLYPFDHYE